MVLFKQCALLMIGTTIFIFAMQEDCLRDQERKNKMEQRRRLREAQESRSHRRYFHRYEESSGDEDDRPFHKGEKKIRIPRKSKL